MKKTLIIAAFFFSLLSCESKKGSWTSDDKEKAKSLVENAIRSDGSNPDEMQDAVDCAVRRMETNYENFEEVEFDEEGAGKIFGECLWKDLKNKVQNDDSSDEVSTEEEPGC